MCEILYTCDKYVLLKHIPLFSQPYDESVFFFLDKLLIEVDNYISKKNREMTRKVIAVKKKTCRGSSKSPRDTKYRPP
jgi:hypothetical protein